MFGYIRPHVPELKVKEYALYRSVYCGICRSMRKQTGCTSCLALSYDSVLVALVSMDAKEETYTVKARRCLAHPWKKREMLEPCAATCYAAGIQTTLLYHQILDHKKDDHGLRRLGASLLSPLGKRWYRNSHIDPTLCDAIAHTMELQEQLEKANCASPDEAAEPTGTMMAEVFAHMGADSVQQRVLHQFGYHLGRCIYWMDAVDDYDKDQKNNRYNPFLLAGERVKENLHIRTAMRLELEQAANAYALLPGKDAGVRAIVENILYEGLPRKMDALLQYDDQSKEVSEGNSDTERKA